MLDSFSAISTLQTLRLYIAFQGKYDDAESLCRSSLAMIEHAQDADHPVMAASLENAANVLQAQVMLKSYIAIYCFDAMSGWGRIYDQSSEG